VKVLILPEDQALDRYILQPVVAGIFKDLETPARVEVLPEPQLRGTGDVLDRDLIAQIVADNVAMTDLFLLFVDRDCDPKHTTKVRDLEALHAGVMITTLPIEELEVWLLALHKEALGARWSDVRAECHPKERFADPLLKSLGAAGPGKGRKSAMRSIKGQWSTLLALCEELRELRERIQDFCLRRRV
jgi:hypothetical protein